MTDLVLSDKHRLAQHLRCPPEHLQFLLSKSYPCGLHNCCYTHVFRTPFGLYAVEYHCGCEYQTVPDGTAAWYNITPISVK